MLSECLERKYVTGVFYQNRLFGCVVKHKGTGPIIPFLYLASFWINNLLSLGNRDLDYLVAFSTVKSDLSFSFTHLSNPLELVVVGQQIVQIEYSRPGYLVKKF